MTKIINLDSLTKPPLMVLEIEGVKHPLKPATVETFLENMKDLEELGIDASPAKEIEVAVRIFSRAFPSIGQEVIRALPIETIQELSKLAREVSGEVATEEKPPEAGKPGKSKKASSAR